MSEDNLQCLLGWLITLGQSDCFSLQLTHCFCLLDGWAKTQHFIKYCFLPNTLDKIQKLDKWLLWFTGLIPEKYLKTHYSSTRYFQCREENHQQQFWALSPWWQVEKSNFVQQFHLTSHWKTAFLASGKNLKLCLLIQGEGTHSDQSASNLKHLNPKAWSALSL